MDDREVVAAIAAGDPTGIAIAYDMYAAALYGYCYWMLRQPADAAEVLQGTFVIAAATLGDLPQAPRLRSWLYSVARKECQRRLQSASAARVEDDNAADRPTDPADQWVSAAGQPIDAADQAADATQQFRALRPSADVADQEIDATQQFRVARQPVGAADGVTGINADTAKAELRTAVRGILAELAPGDREIIELNLRHELDDADLATALGVSWSRARTLASRARSRLEKALGALIVARTGREACPALDTVLAGQDGQLTEQTRDLVAGHIEQCEVCFDYRWGALRPVALSGLSPLAELPMALREQVLSFCSATTPDAVAYRQRVTRRAKSLWLAGSSQVARRMRWRSGREIPRPSTAAVVLAVWVVAVWTVSMTLLIFTGSHPSHVLAGRPGATIPSTSPAAATTIAIAPATVPTSASVKPFPTVSQAKAVVPPPVVPSAAPTENAEPSPSSPPSSTNSSSSKPSKSPSPKPSKSPSPSSSPSRKPSPSPSPSRSSSA